MAEYRVVEVSGWKAFDQEPLGTKRKVWLEAPDGSLWLFKYRHRPETGDDWAEKIAAEIARALALPAAVADLATLGGAPGAAVLDFTDQTERGELVLGNQLLFEQDPRYPHERRFHVAEHTVERVLTALEELHVAGPLGYPTHSGTESAGAALAGYLLLDALVGNQDRHHENWGLLISRSGDAASRAIAPTFDHAYSLGQILTDDERRLRLETRDKGFTVSAYAAKARSALYRAAGDRQPLGTFESFDLVAHRYDRASRFWLERLSHVTENMLAGFVDAVPEVRMSPWAKRFAVEMLCCNRATLLGRRPA